MLIETINWTKDVKCLYCLHRHTVKTNDIKYADLRQPFLFIPDWQFYVDCPECSYRLILSDIPAWVTLAVQQREQNAEEA